MEIKSLANTDFGTLAEAFAAAFATYEVQVTPDELRTMLRRRGFDPALSFAAFDGNGHIAGFTLNGVGTFGGVPTVYDTGTGTLPDHRGQGLATRIFEASLPYLRAAGIGQYLLEVLQHNTAAVSVYRKLGFEVSREFHYFRATAGGDVPVCGGEWMDEIQRLSGIARDDGMRVVCVPIGEVRSFAPEFWDFEPSWQNGFEAIERAPEDFVTLGAFDGDRLVGYIVFELAAGDITQIAVAKTHRRQGVGSALLGEMLRLNRATGVKCINTEIGRDEALADFLQARGILLAGKQFEMIKKL